MSAYIVVIINTFRDNKEELGFIPIYRHHDESNGWGLGG